MKERIVKFGKRIATGVAMTIMVVAGMVAVPQAADAAVGYWSPTYSTNSSCLSMQNIYKRQFGATIMTGCAYNPQTGGYNFYYVYR